MKIVETTTSDGLIYKGLLSEAKSSKKIIIHIHGMSGDIYSNSFYPEMYSKYPKSGLSFLAGEHRGTHSIKQFNTNTGQVRNIGNAYEIFEESSLDIQAWINKALEMGYDQIWLQAHSLGPSKVAYYIKNNTENKVKGLIFLSPSDMVGLVSDKAGKKDHDIILPLAKNLVEENKGGSILEHDLWECMRLSAKTYLNFFDKNSNTAIFNFGNPQLGWEVVNFINIPVLAFTGTKDDGIAPVMDPKKAMKILEKELCNSPKVKTVVFDEAEHDFKGFAKEIVDAVIKFID